MSCYFRHIRDVFEFAGIEVTPKNKKDIDRMIHQLVDVEYKQCHRAWKALKVEIASRPGGREGFAKKLQAKLKA
jgi:hypothetical protein